MNIGKQKTAIFKNSSRRWLFSLLVYVCLCARFFPQKVGRELCHFLVDPAKVSGKHHLFLMLVLKAILLGQWCIVLLFFLNMAHIEVSFTEELCGFELLCLFKVHTVHGLGLRSREVTSRLTAYPASGHVGNLRGGNQAVHLLVQRGRDSLIIDADALGGLLDLAEDIVL